MKPALNHLVIRRSLLAFAAGSYLGLGGAETRSPRPPRVAAPYFTHSEFVLNALERHFVPLSRAFARSTLALREQLANQCNQPKAREAWRTAMLDWERLSAVAVGPLIERRSARTIDFWPARPPMIVAAIQSPPADAAGLDLVGAPAKGLPALEWLLWQRGLTPAQCAYAALLGEACATEAQMIRSKFEVLAAQRWTEETALPVFQEWFGQAVGGLEQLRWKKMGKPARSARKADWPRGTSGQTRAAWQAQWEGLENFLVGPSRSEEQGSLNAYLAGDAQMQLSARLEVASDTVRRQIAAADPSKPTSINSAVKALADIRVLLDDPIATALQTLVGFSDADGD